MIDTKVIESFRGRSALVTGGTGLIGRQIVDILCGTGADVTSVSLDDLAIDKRAAYVKGDLLDFGFCKTITKGVDFVFHVAGIKGSIEVTKKKPASFFVPLLMMNTNVLEACRINKVGKIVYTSSIGAYPSAEVFREDEGTSGEPMDLFPGWAKRIAEMQVRAYFLQYGLTNYSIVRPCNVYGPGDNFDSENAMVVPSLMCRIFRKEDPVVIWGDGSAIRDFAYSRDIAEGVILALYYGTGPGFVNLGSGKGTTIRELVETLRGFIEFNYVFDATKSSGFRRRVMDIAMAREKIRYNPMTSLADGLRETWRWYTAHAAEHLERKNYFREG